MKSDKQLEFVGMGRPPIRYELRRLNDSLWAPRPVASIRSTYEIRENQNMGEENIPMIRQATIADASRIAEILIFTKRMNYRKIFRDDKVSFGEMQVYPLAKRYIDNPQKLAGIWVYDDEFVKGMIHISENQILELYVDSFFENQGIGSNLIAFAIEQMHCDFLWVLEKNRKAQRFYQRHGFAITKEKKYQEGTTEFVIKMSR